jgi:hypothetical protein
MAATAALDPRAICTSLADLHARLNTIRPRPAQERFLPGATIFMRPGEDNPFPSSAANRVMLYDPAAAPLDETARAARDILNQHAVHHWFLEIGPGAIAADIENVREMLHARVWPHVRYPALVRIPADVPRPPTTLTIRRATPEDATAHAAEIDAIWSKPGSSTAAIAAAKTPGYHPVLGFAGDRAVALGILIESSKPGGPAYLASGGTHPEFRGRGGQSAIIAERVRIAHEIGCTLCISETVLTDPTSTKNLLRAGFNFVFEWVVLEIGSPKETATR